jgi:NifB/MoaA-like Fe-S oxidoreductase
VVSEGLSPLHVSIHATDPDVRADLLHNPRGGSSLRWLRALLDHGVEVHGQVVVCPGVNDGAVLDDTMVGVLDRYPELSTVAVVPLGVSRFNTAERMRPHTTAEAAAVVDCVEGWQDLYLAVLGRRLAYAADEYYLLAGRPFPSADTYGAFAMHEDGIGMARSFEQEFLGDVDDDAPGRDGFFAWADAGAAAAAGDGEYEAYRGPRSTAVDVPVRLRARAGAPVGVLTGAYGRAVVEPLIASLGRTDARVVEVPNAYFGGNIGVTGLMVGEDVARALEAEPAGHRYLLPDVCLSQGRFLDGTGLDDLPRPVEVVATDGRALRQALEA